MGIFCRLEVHNDYQVLSRIEAGQTENGVDGYFVITRCDAGVVVEAKEGTWEDSVEGYDAALAFMNAIDLAEFANAAQEMGSFMADQEGK